MNTNNLGCQSHMDNTLNNEESGLGHTQNNYIFSVALALSHFGNREASQIRRL